MSAPGDDATERAVSDALFALLCDCPEEGVCRPECAANNNYIDLGPLAIQALRSLPVEARMEAMGMERSGWSGHRRGVWNEVGRVHDKNSVHMDGCIPLYIEAPVSPPERMGE